jgi:hypothetical protein
VEELRTSEEWQKLCVVQVIDPDGWDRKNYQYSWYEEKISRGEFEKRMFISTVRNLSALAMRGDVSIWKDRNV